MIEDKIPLTFEEEKTLINRYLVDEIFNAAKVEGIPTTYLDTENLVYNNINPSLDEYNLAKLKNLKDAYKCLLDEEFLSKDVSLETLCHLNLIINGRGIVAHPGELRIDSVSIHGTTYKPPLPDPYQINNYIIDMFNSDVSKTELALHLYCYIMRSQPYIDGNKRTGNLFANFILAKFGQGLVSIPSNKRKTFFSLLVKYYESNDDSKLIRFFVDHCLFYAK